MTRSELTRRGYAMTDDLESSHDRPSYEDIISPKDVVEPPVWQRQVDAEINAPRKPMPKSKPSLKSAKSPRAKQAKRRVSPPIGNQPRRQVTPKDYPRQLLRVRKEKDGTKTDFHEAHFGGKHPYRAEVAFRSLGELRQFKREGRLIGIRITPTISTPGKRPQVNMVGIKNIKGL